MYKILAIIYLKLDELSLFYGFTVQELNPAYTSQKCSECGYLDKNNRSTQSIFKCLCCNKKLNADIQESIVVSKHFRTQQSSYKSPYRGIILRNCENYIYFLHNFPKSHKIKYFIVIGILT